jgi:hypothetical protein
VQLPDRIRQRFGRRPGFGKQRAIGVECVVAVA